MKTGRINSAVDKPNHPVLRAFPLDLVKYLEIVVVAVWDIIPCPANLIKKIEINNKIKEEILEKKKHENDISKITDIEIVRSGPVAISSKNQEKEEWWEFIMIEMLTLT